MSKPEYRSSASMTLWIVGAFLIVAVAAMIAFAPAVECPSCHGKGLTKGDWAVLGGQPLAETCQTCYLKGRITLLRRWTQKGASAAGGRGR